MSALRLASVVIRLVLGVTMLIVCAWVTGLAVESSAFIVAVGAGLYGLVLIGGAGRDSREIGA